MSVLSVRVTYRPDNRPKPRYATSCAQTVKLAQYFRWQREERRASSTRGRALTSAYELWTLWVPARFSGVSLQWILILILTLSRYKIFTIVLRLHGGVFSRNTVTDQTNTHTHLCCAHILSAPWQRCAEKCVTGSAIQCSE